MGEELVILTAHEVLAQWASTLGRCLVVHHDGTKFNQLASRNTQLRAFAARPDGESDEVETAPACLRLRVLLPAPENTALR